MTRMGQRDPEMLAMLAMCETLAKNDGNLGKVNWLGLDTISFPLRREGALAVRLLRLHLGPRASTLRSRLLPPAPTLTPLQEGNAWRAGHRPLLHSGLGGHFSV